MAAGTERLDAADDALCVRCPNGPGCLYRRIHLRSQGKGNSHRGIGKAAVMWFAWTTQRQNCQRSPDGNAT